MCSSACRCATATKPASWSRSCGGTGLPTLDFSDNEMAKLHVRHLVGGRAPAVKNEMLYRFEFPERPGALMNFLNSMSHDWNISLFHYRNHGADYGRVLVGMQVPPRDEARIPALPGAARLRLAGTRPAIPRHSLFLS